MQKKYTKIFAKIPITAGMAFFKRGFRKEACIPGFFSGLESALFVSRYFSKEREELKNKEQVEHIQQLAQNKSDADKEVKSLDNNVQIRLCTEDDAETMSKIYKEIFATYPFPIDEPEYLIETMRTHVVYYGIEINKKLVAISSAEIDKYNKNAEMTDFATLPEWRGHGFASNLLSFMEQELEKQDILTLYTIARAISLGMNMTFGKLNYNFAGRLINNTNISGNIESMNIWYKRL